MERVYGVDGVCAICLGAGLEGNTRVRLPCGHVFHQACVALLPVQHQPILAQAVVNLEMRASESEQLFIDNPGGFGPWRPYGNQYPAQHPNRVNQGLRGIWWINDRTGETVGCPPH